jgi:hypothetical protein
VSNSTFYLNGVTSLHSATDAIIGPGGSSGSYSAANTGITGSHNPFVYQTATWTFSLSGLPANFSVGSINFSYNTGPGDNFSCNSDAAHCIAPPLQVKGPPQTTQSDPVSGVPEPVSFLLAGTGLLGLFFLRRRTQPVR